MPLPATGNQAGLIPYFSPHFNAIWWATSKDKLMHWDMASNKAHPTCFVRKSHGFRFFERAPPAPTPRLWHCRACTAHAFCSLPFPDLQRPGSLRLTDLRNL